VWVLEKLSHPEGKWFKSENEASYSSLMSGMVLGFSCHPQTILNYEKTLTEASKTEVQKQIKEAIRVRLLTCIELNDLSLSQHFFFFCISTLYPT